MMKALNDLCIKISLCNRTSLMSIFHHKDRSVPSSCQITSFASFLIFPYFSLFFLIFPYFFYLFNCYEIRKYLYLFIWAKLEVIKNDTLLLPALAETRALNCRTSTHEAVGLSALSPCSLVAISSGKFLQNLPISRLLQCGEQQQQHQHQRRSRHGHVSTREDRKGSKVGRLASF